MADTELATHFRFGDNWHRFAAHIDEQRIAEATRGLRKLFPGDELRNVRFLDIGCGSGLMMVAALRLGAASVHGFDLDPRSVETSRRTLERFAGESDYHVEEASILTVDIETTGQFDVVYSWGVLHHTGQMWRALDRAATLVLPNGLLAIALYRQTPLCGLWRIEKRLYSRASVPIQAAIRGIYKASYFLALLAQGRDPWRYVRDYVSVRGMKWHHDVHDWLGGYPYESTTPAEVDESLRRRNFRMVRAFGKDAAAKGLFGTGCDEFVARRHV
jgi:2-polyprenyl-3-methyl-5-hydroxy-6-metoxy-1,4-benzoquinol methylase